MLFFSLSFLVIDPRLPRLTSSVFFACQIIDLPCSRRCVFSSFFFWMDKSIYAMCPFQTSLYSVRSCWYYSHDWLFLCNMSIDLVSNLSYFWSLLIRFSMNSDSLTESFNKCSALWGDTHLGNYVLLLLKVLKWKAFADWACSLFIFAVSIIWRCCFRDDYDV